MAVIQNNKYNNSMIYTIRSPHTNKFYIGSTTQKICKRFTNHKANYKAYLNGTYNFVTSFKILELGDAYIELLEEINCDTKTQLEMREGELIRIHKDLCINKKIEGRTGEQYYIDNADKSRQYYIDNADKIKQYQLNNADKIKQYYIDSADKIKQRRKQYKLDNADKIKQCNKQYYQNSKILKISIAKEDYDVLVYCDKLMNLQYSYKNFIIV